MHASIQQRVDGVAALHIRSRIATAEFYALIGKEQPVRQIPYQVIARGKAYHIVEWATGKTRGFRWTHKEAVSLAESLERSANKLASQCIA
jgi:hypothetical protein